MYCPHCGQQQATSDMRFCSRCGFPLVGVIQLLNNGGALPLAQASEQGLNLSPRQKGIRHGAMLMLSTLFIVPVTAILTINVFGSPKLFVPLAAFICFIGGLLRILYAMLFEEDWSRMAQPQPPAYIAPPMPSELRAPPRNSALPPPQSTPVSSWRPRADTAELVRPPSVTENTTRLLDEKADPRKL